MLRCSGSFLRLFALISATLPRSNVQCRFGRLILPSSQAEFANYRARRRGGSPMPYGSARYSWQSLCILICRMFQWF